MLRGNYTLAKITAQPPLPHVQSPIVVKILKAWLESTKDFVNCALFFSLSVMAELLVARLERLLKILIHYGDIDRPDKLRKLLLIGRLDGHQNFSTTKLDA